MYRGFCYYLTADERAGDLVSELRNRRRPSWCWICCASSAPSCRWAGRICYRGGRGVAEDRSRRRSRRPDRARKSPAR
nr:hypothetical protein [Kribbella capetownensis]